MKWVILRRIQWGYIMEYSGVCVCVCTVHTKVLSGYGTRSLSSPPNTGYINTVPPDSCPPAQLVYICVHLFPYSHWPPFSILRVHLNREIMCSVGLDSCPVTLITTAMLTLHPEILSYLALDGIVPPCQQHISSSSSPSTSICFARTHLSSSTHTSPPHGI